MDYQQGNEDYATQHQQQHHQSALPLNLPPGMSHTGAMMQTHSPYQPAYLVNTPMGLTMPYTAQQMNGSLGGYGSAPVAASYHGRSDSIHNQSDQDFYGDPAASDRGGGGIPRSMASLTDHSGQHLPLQGPGLDNNHQPSLERCIIKTTTDALIALSAAYHGYIPIITRRPEEQRLKELTASGNVIIFDSEASKIKRWTDPHHWSPSRVIGDNFLVYREINAPKGTAKAKNPKEGAGPSRSRASRRASAREAAGAPYSTPCRRRSSGEPVEDITRELVGALVDSYDFKEGGMVKKSITCSVGGKAYHLICYYTLEDGIRMWDDPMASPTGRQQSDPSCTYRDVGIDTNLLGVEKLKNPQTKIDLDTTELGTSIHNQTSQPHQHQHAAMQPPMALPQSYAVPQTYPPALPFGQVSAPGFSSVSSSGMLQPSPHAQTLMQMPGMLHPPPGYLSDNVQQPQYAATYHDSNQSQNSLAYQPFSRWAKDFQAVVIDPASNLK